MKNVFYHAGQFLALGGWGLLMVPWLVIWGWGIDRKTKRLIALSAFLATGCDRGTRDSFMAAKESGATDKEVQGAMAVAATLAAQRPHQLEECPSGYFRRENEKGKRAAQECRFK